MRQNKLTVTVSPHAKSKITVSNIMLDVIISLIPALIASVVIFGYRTLLVAATTIICAVLAEYVSRRVMKRSNTIGDLSAVVTGLILAFNLPVGVPLWIAAIGSIFAIVVVKQFFGGIGENFVNPAIAARIVLMVSFPTAMTTWAKPLAWKAGEALTTATPLATLNNGTENLPSLMQMLLGVRGGCLGETCAIALIVGGIYLMIKKVISPAIPLSFIGTVAVFMFFTGSAKFGFFSIESFKFLAYELLGGGLMLGAFFMATDYTTSPINTKGRIIFGIGCGLITSMIRVFGNLPEGVSFSIILMNILVPHIENLCIPKPFGTVKEKKSKKEKKEAAKA